MTVPATDPPRAARGAAAPDAVPAAKGTPAQRAARIGLVRDWDFVLHLPLRYVDETRVVAIADLAVGATGQVDGEIVDVQVAVRRRRQLLVRLRDASGEILLRWVNFYASQQTQLQVGRRVRVLGAVRGGLMGVEMVHPQVRVIDAATPLPVHLTPVYPAGEGISQLWLRRRIARALDQADMADALPEALRQSLALPELGVALRTLHRPPAADTAADAAARAAAWQRLRFDELLAQQLALRQARARRRRDGAAPLAGAATLTGALLAALPFALTDDQRRVWGEIARDLAARGADEPPAARRCRQRQDHRCRAGRRPRDRSRLPGGADGAHRDPGRPALPAHRGAARAAGRARSPGWAAAGARANARARRWPTSPRAPPGWWSAPMR